MKEYALSGVYSNGSDLYKLLDKKKLNYLIVKIKKEKGERKK